MLAAADAPARDDRPESPPMRILSVRSLADESSYIYAPLEERIPIGSADVSGGNQPPLYIFNPVRRRSDLPLSGAVNPALYTPDSKSGDSQTDFSCTSNPLVPENAAFEPFIPLKKIKEEIESETPLSTDKDSRPTADDRAAGHGSNSLPETTTKKSRKTKSPERRDLLGRKENASTPTTACEDLRDPEDGSQFYFEFDPYSSPFDDSDEERAHEVERTLEGVNHKNFTTGILRELDVHNSGDNGEPRGRLESDHSYSKPNHEHPTLTPEESLGTRLESSPRTTSPSGNAPVPKLIVRLPKKMVCDRGNKQRGIRKPARRRRKNSSSSNNSTDTSSGISAGSRIPETAEERSQRQKHLLNERKITESMIILTKMRNVMSQARSGSLNSGTAMRDKLFFLENLSQYLRRNDFSKEPLNRSILNAMAEWLSPLPNGNLPPLKLRSRLVNLLRDLNRTTPAQVFQSSSIEGVLILLMNHPKESAKNKALEWQLVNSWS
ncbi:protein IWS1 homolog [Galendromus occidentalis]|uniref:Protein IWS1 homolog n=1 Tax=Galendromus occidentalis TaxID=34638 RepID=A0AAJ7L453_9ACAR|nr:protein IWS1 homolog [Galendromus occidentalis]